MTTPRARAAGAREPGGGAGAAPATVSIVLNGEARSVDAGLSVAGLLQSLELAPGMVVVERNRAILARDAMGDTPVEEGDRFELVHFVGGG